MMEKINQYYKITNVKPEYHRLDPPYYKPSKKRIMFNGKELELHYLNEFKTYISDETIQDFKKSITGGSDSKKILVIL